MCPSNRGLHLLSRVQGGSLELSFQLCLVMVSILAAARYDLTMLLKLEETLTRRGKGDVSFVPKPKEVHVAAVPKRF
eukprot:4617619-Amphidinium_carterae.1